MPVNFDDLCDMLRRFAAERYPGHRGAAFRVVLADGSRLVVPVGTGPAVASPVPGPADRQPPLSEPKQEILQVFHEARPGERIKVEEIARRIGREVNSRFRSHLSDLSRLGILEPSLRDGYRLVVNRAGGPPG
jgi:hypothetical protein